MHAWHPYPERSSAGTGRTCRRRAERPELEWKQSPLDSVPATMLPCMLTMVTLHSNSRISNILIGPWCAQHGRKADKQRRPVLSNNAKNVSPTVTFVRGLFRKNFQVVTVRLLAKQREGHFNLHNANHLTFICYYFVLICLWVKWKNVRFV